MRTQSEQIAGQAFRAALLQENILRLKIIGSAGLVPNAVLIVLAWIKPESPGFSGFDTRIRLLWTVATLLFFLAAGICSAFRRGKVFLRPVLLTAAMLCPLFASLLTVSLFGSNARTFVYIINILIIGAFLFLSFFEFLIVQLPGFGYLLFGLISKSPGPDIFVPVLINVSAMILISLGMSVLNFRIKKSQFLAQEELRKANLELKALADLDGLTGLPNRRKIAETLVFWRSLLERKPLEFALIMLDVDFFKPYNDTYGHLAGDDCLKLIAGIIRDSLKRQSDFVGRFGGEEFLVILPQTGLSGAHGIAEGIRESVFGAAMMHAAADRGVLSISAGVAVSSHCPGSKLDLLIEAADRALYRAKQNGRNCVVVEDLRIL